MEGLITIPKIQKYKFTPYITILNSHSQFGKIEPWVNGLIIERFFAVIIQNHTLLNLIDRKKEILCKKIS